MIEVCESNEDQVRERESERRVNCYPPSSVCPLLSAHKVAVLVHDGYGHKSNVSQGH